MTDYKASKRIVGTSAERDPTWEQTTQSTWWNMYENVYYGVKLGSSSSQVGETISSVDMYLKASSSSEASTVQVIRGTSVIGESASVAGSTITSSGGWITFSFSTGVSLQASDYILFKRTNPAAITNGSEIFAGSASSTDNDLTTYWSNNPLSLNLSSGVLPTMRIRTEGITNAQTYSIFSETDTGKDYIWSGSAWTEVA